MRAKPVEDAPIMPADTSGAAVAMGGPVAEWQREIEQRYLAWPIAPAAPDRGERVLAGVSRFAGYAALATGYAAIGLLILT